MPLLSLKHIVSCSSEDPNNPSDNLLGEEVYRKWKGANPGEKQLTVVIQLEKSSHIHSIDIGNDGSAFVEVLVGRSSSSSEEFQVLLVASAFMSPAESKSWTNTNRVRMFGKEKLSRSTVDQKWDLVKVVCTQPYNKKEKYGLSFIKLSSPTDQSSKGEQSEQSSSSSTSAPKKIGAFSVREEEPVPTSGSMLFKKHMKKEETSTPKTSDMSVAAQAKAASLSALKEKKIEEEQKEKEPKRTKPKSGAVQPVRGAASTTSGVKRPSIKSSETSSPVQHPKRKKIGRKDKDFGSLLSKVNFVLSGFKNPFRGQLRDKAVAMGAQYDPDWGPTSTHLVCAFPNTPKFNEVKKKGGIIVKKEWILDCYEKKRKLPTKTYRLVPGGNSDDASSSEDESPPPTQSPPLKKATDENMEDDPYAGSTDEETDQPPGGQMSNEPSSDGGDTDDEVQHIQALQQKTGRDKEEDDGGIYSGSTEVESSEETEGNSKTQKSLLDLPNFFSKCHFLLYGNFEPAKRRLLTRYITAYDGHIENYMGDSVSHVVSNEKWDSNFDDALKENASLMFITPGWVFACHNKQKLISPSNFAITR